MVNKKDLRIALEPIGFVFGVLLFSVIAILIFREIGIEDLSNLLFFIPKWVFVSLGIILITLFSFTFIYGMFDLNKNLSYPAKRLIVTGMYHYVRHPIYCGISFTYIGIGLLYQSLGFLTAGVLWLALFYTQAKKEEKHLVSIFKETYIHYVKSTPMIFPDFFGLISSLLKK